jgi:hypothetical protein
VAIEPAIFGYHPDCKEIHFPSLAALQACAASKGGQDALANAHKISNGGAPVVIVAEEEIINF